MTHPMVTLLDDEQCWARLQRNMVGRLALYTGSTIVVSPVHYILVDGNFYFQTVSREKLKSIVVSRIAALEIDREGKSGELMSVTVRGIAHWHTHELDMPELDAVRVGSVPDAMHWVKLVPESVSGHILTPQKHPLHEPLA